METTRKAEKNILIAFLRLYNKSWGKPQQKG